MIPEYKRRITIRLSPNDRCRIEQLVNEGRFENISEVIRKAIEEFLLKEEGTCV